MVGIFVFGCANDVEEIKRVTEYESLAAQTIKDAQISYSDSGRLEFTIEAGQIDRYPGDEPRDEFSGGVTVISFDRDGNMASEINAENATSFPNEKKMIARDNVMLVDDEGKKLETELLTWLEEEEKIFTDKFVKITTPTEILYGDGLEADQNFTSYEIKNIKGRIKVQENEEDESLPQDK